MTFRISGFAIAAYALAGILGSAQSLAENAYITNFGSGTVSVIDTATDTATATIPVGNLPAGVAVTPDGSKVYVTHFTPSEVPSGTVSVIDVHSDEIVSNIKVGTRPWGMALSPDGKYLFTANGPSDDISVIDTKSNQEIQRVKAGKSPWSIAVVAAD